MGSQDLISIVKRVEHWSVLNPDGIALIAVNQAEEESKISWLELRERSNQAAHCLAQLGVAKNSCVLVSMPNSIEHVILALGIWKLGACYTPVCNTASRVEQQAFLGLVQPTLVVSGWEKNSYNGVMRTWKDLQVETFSTEDLPDCIARPARAVGTGGSTGTPKVVVLETPAAYSEESMKVWYQITGQREGGVQLIANPLYHTSPNTSLIMALFSGQTVILMERFREYLFGELVQRYKVNFVTIVPTMMDRLLRIDAVMDYDFSSIESLCHNGGFCQQWLKMAWINKLGAEKVYEFYSMTEMIGMTVIRGDEWLKYQGSVGRAVGCTIEVRDDKGNPQPPHCIGEIFMKTGGAPPFHYMGYPQLRDDGDGYYTVGDLGWLNEEGYLFFADRRIDMIVTGGSNVYTAEVEGALLKHPGVKDVVVIGIPDEIWGKRIHAVIEPVSWSNLPTVDELKKVCKEQLASYKVPKGFEFIESLPRNAMGKIRRAELITAHEPHKS